MDGTTVIVRALLLATAAYYACTAIWHPGYSWWVYLCVIVVVEWVLGWLLQIVATARRGE